MDTNRQSGEYSFEGLPGYTITLSNVPENITPTLLPMSPEDVEKLTNLNRDGNIGLITSVAGNLVFSDENGEQVHSFSSPIRLTYNFTSADEEKRRDREKKLQEQKDKEKGNSAKDVTVRLVPIFLYQYDPDKGSTPEFEVWLPFQNFSYDPRKLTVTIDFLFWGDQPIGGGSQP